MAEFIHQFMIINQGIIPRKSVSIDLSDIVISFLEDEIWNQYEDHTGNTNFAISVELADIQKAFSKHKDYITKDYLVNIVEKFIDEIRYGIFLGGKYNDFTYYISTLGNDTALWIILKRI